jgi:hypothetical protein
MKVRVVRPLCVGGIRREVGAIVDLPNAQEAISSGRAERIVEAAPPVGPMTTETVPEIVAGKKRKVAQKEQDHVAS